MTTLTGDDRVDDLPGPAARIGERPTAGRDPDRDTIASRLHLNRHVTQIALGVLWIIDAGLQFQPRMFGNGFVTMVIAPNAAGQPSVVASSIDHMSHFLSHDVALWNTVFGLAQLAIGVGILLRRTRKAALLGSFSWAFGVWWFGEGFGGILTGHASALMGAPGAVVLYAVVGLLVWPRTGDDRTDEPVPAPAAEATGVASAAAGHGVLGGTVGLAV